MLDVPIESAYAPNVFLNVTFVHEGDMYTDSKRLLVPARDKMLNLEVIPNKAEYRPRDIASYTILARDADGAPVRNAEVSQIGSTRLNSSHSQISYAVFCLKKKKQNRKKHTMI